MEIGFMPEKIQEISSEIEFAKENFDFIEKTSEKNLSKYNRKYILKMKKLLKGFNVIGHIHWEINILNKKGLMTTKKIISILKEFGTKRIVIHPYNGKEKDFEKLKQKNIFSLREIDKFCKRRKIKLLIENKDKPPFNTAKSFLDNLSGIDIALDIGHAKKVSPKEVDNFLKLKRKIKHVHLHDAEGQSDHIAFRNNDELRELIKKIKKANPNVTITLEIFRKLKNTKLVSLEKEERKEVLINQLKLIGMLNKK